MLHEDIEKVVFSEEQIQNRIAEMAKEITEDYKDVKEDVRVFGSKDLICLNFYIDYMQIYNKIRNIRRNYYKDYPQA